MRHARGGPLRCVWPAALATLLLGGNAAVAQEAPRALVVVDYVGVEGVYLPIGTDEGAQVGDTLSVYLSTTTATPLGELTISSAARSRSVATILPPSFPIARGDSIYLAVTPIALAESAPEPVVTPRETAPVPERQMARPVSARVSGRVSFDIDARETRTSWEGQDLFGTTRRRFATPVSSVSLRVSELPGGLRLETNLRASYRYTEGGGTAIRPTTSVRVYNLSLVKLPDTAPLELRIGRFYNPHEPYSSYWDGALVRLGSRTGPGIGVAAGFDPERGNEGLSQDVPKITGFVDFRRSGRSWSYATDVSFHHMRPKDALLPNLTFAGWSQRVRLGRASLSQRLRVDRDVETGKWTVAQLRLRATVSVAGPLRVNLGFGRTRPSAFRGVPATLASEREEMTAGLGLLGPGGSLLFEAGSTRWSGEERGLSLSGSASKDLGPLLVYASGRYWSRAGMTTIGGSPGFSFAWQWLTTRAGYQFYKTESSSALTSHSGSVDFTATPTRGLWITLGGEEQWGQNFGGTRLRLSVGRSF